jgi:anaerobic magnesium-protoporphyrin IX monomethyl ester cyclase
MAKILFVYNIWHEAFSIMQLSSVVKAGGHTTDLLLDNGNIHRLINYVDRTKPDIIGFSIMTGQHTWALRVAEEIKKRSKESGSLIIFGGPHPTFVPDIIENDPVDIVCVGEGEGALLDLMNALENKKEIAGIQNLWIKREGRIIKNNVRPLIHDLDVLPFADREIMYKMGYFRSNPNKGIITGRGCPGKCSFCYNEPYRKLYSNTPGYVRKRSAANVIQEIKELMQNYKHTKYIRFQDDLLAINKKWLFEFLNAYRAEVKLPFMCYIRADYIDEDMIRALAESQCVLVNFGIESGDHRVRNGLLNKKVTDEDIYTTAHLLKKYKIPIFTDNMAFIPKTTLRHIWKTIRMNQRIKADYAILNRFQPYPGTPIYQTLCDEHLIQSKYYDTRDDVYSYVNVIKEKRIVETNIHSLFILFIKFPWMTPILKKIIKVKPNALFRLFYKISFGLEHKARYKLGLGRFLREAIHHYRFK